MAHPRAQAGFTLAETLVALALLAAVLLPVSGATAAAMSLWNSMRQREVAARAVLNAAAALEAVPFGRLLPGEHKLPGPDLPQAATTVTIQWDQERQLVRANVRVAWVGPSGPRSLARDVLRSPFGPYRPGGEPDEEEEQP